MHTHTCIYIYIYILAVGTRPSDGKIYFPYHYSNIFKEQKLENFAAKVAFGGARKYDHATPTLRELKWLNMKCKITLDICIFTYKICNKLLPEWLFSLPTVGNTVTRNTRQSNNLFIQRTYTDIGARSILVKAPAIYNSIPENIKKSSSLHLFKEKLKTYLLNP